MTISKQAKIVIRIFGFLIGGYLGYLLTSVILGYVTLPSSGINWELFMYLGISAIIAVILLLLSVPIVKGIFKIGNFIERKLNKYTSAEITGGIVGFIAGLLIAFLLSYIFQFVKQDSLRAFLIILIYLLLGYLGIILGRKYISQIAIFTNKSTAVSQKIILDTSAIIDGRILELAKTNFLNGKFVIANFILNELRRISDSPDALKRNRGRRGLDIISALQNEKNFDVEICDIDFPDADLDTKVLKLAGSLNASVITTDYNLNKVATVLKVKVLNLNELSNAIKPVALPGEKMTLNIVKQGKDKEQGVGFLEDGTMIVVENGGGYVGKTVEVYVTTSLQTNAGRMIFTRIENI